MKMMQWLLLDRIETESRGAAVAREEHAAALVLAHEAKAALALVQTAVPRAQIARHPAVLRGVPPPSRRRARLWVLAHPRGSLAPTRAGIERASAKAPGVPGRTRRASRPRRARRSAPVRPPARVPPARGRPGGRPRGCWPLARSGYRSCGRCPN